MITQQSKSSESIPKQSIQYPQNLEVLKPELASINELDQPDTYLLIIEMFVQQYTSFNNEVHRAIIANNGPELHTLVHTLKGSAGALGLQKLNEIATELDLQLTQRVHVETLQFEPLYRFVKKSIADCQAVLDLNQRDTAATDLPQDSDLSDMLVTLRAKLHNHELITQPFLDMLITLLNDQNCRKYDRVVELVQQFEYSKAYQSLVALD